MTLHTWEYLGRVQALLGNITQANGYYTNAGLVVTRDPDQIELDDPARIVVMLDGMRAPDDPGMRKVGVQAVFSVVGQVPKTMDSAQQRMHELAADIHRCMGDRTLQMAYFAPGNEWPIPQFSESNVVPPADGINWIGSASRYTAALRLRITPTTPIT